MPRIHGLEALMDSDEEALMDSDSDEEAWFLDELFEDDQPETFEFQVDGPDEEAFPSTLPDSTSKVIDFTEKLVASEELGRLVDNSLFPVEQFPQVAEGAVRLLREKNQADLSNARESLLRKLDEAIEENTSAMRNEEFRSEHTEISNSNCETCTKITEDIFALIYLLHDYYDDSHDPYYDKDIIIEDL